MLPSFLPTRLVVRWPVAFLPAFWLSSPMCVPSWAHQVIASISVVGVTADGSLSPGTTTTVSTGGSGAAPALLLPAAGGVQVVLRGANFGFASDAHCVFATWVGAVGQPHCDAMESFVGEGEVRVTSYCRRLPLALVWCRQRRPTAFACLLVCLFACVLVCLHITREISLGYTVRHSYTRRKLPPSLPHVTQSCGLSLHRLTRVASAPCVPCVRVFWQDFAL